MIRQSDSQRAIPAPPTALLLDMNAPASQIHKPEMSTQQSQQGPAIPGAPRPLHHRGKSVLKSDLYPVSAAPLKLLPSAQQPLAPPARRQQPHQLDSPRGIFVGSAPFLNQNSYSGNTTAFSLPPNVNTFDL